MTTPLDPASPSPSASPTGSAAGAAGTELRRLWRTLRTPEGQRWFAWALLALLVLVDSILVCQHSVARYQTYHADAFDLGNMNQAVWNTLHGNPFRFTNRGLDWFGPPTRLGIHVEPILLLLAPFYLIHSGPETLIVIQNVAMALGAIPLFMLSLRRLPTLPLLGVAFAASYLLAPEFLGAALKNILANPLLPFSILDANRFGYLAMLLRTGGGLGVFMPALWLCALPELAVNILSSHVEQYSGFFQYNAVILAYVMPAAVYGVAALWEARRRVERGEPSPRPAWPAETTLRARVVALWRRLLWGWRWLLEHIPVPSRWIAPLVIAWLLVTGWWNLTTTAGGMIGSFWHAGDHPIPHQAAVNALLDRVPQSASVAATDSLNPRLSSRYTIYLMPDPQSYLADYVAVDIPNAIAVSQADDRQMLGIMLQSGRYRLVGQVGDVMLLHLVGPPISPGGSAG